MSIYKELNDLNLDLSEFEEVTLSKKEQRRILKRVNKEIYFNKGMKKTAVAAAAAAVFVLSFTLATGKVTIANMPFVGEAIEKYINSNETPNYSAYKTEIGETAENELGKLTLNEIMMDDRQLFLSSTFEPADSVHFDYKTHITPKVRINGSDYTITTGGQSVEMNNGMYTIYSDIDLSHDIQTENAKIEIRYDTWNFEKDIEHPWTFNVEFSQAGILAEKRTFELDKTVTLKNNETVTIQKVVTTPISTAVYYDLTNNTSEDLYFKIETDEGTSEDFTSAKTSNKSGDVSVVRFNGLSLKDKGYFLVAYNSEGVRLSEPVRIN